MNSRHRLGSLIGFVILVACLVAGGWVVLNRQFVTDQVKAWSYEPSSSAASIQKNLKLTGRGTLLYEASDTKLEKADRFNDSCAQHTETKNPIVGCYANYNIFIYDVDNAKLDGIEDVTAAHELLHAAYQRLSDQEKSRIDKLLEAAYQRVKTPDLETRMAYYRKNEPGQEKNELHSILGTEFSDIGPELESYYKTYFKERSNIVGYHDKYQAVFDELESKAESINQQLTTLQAKITTEKADYNNQSADLNDDIKAFRQKNDSGGFTNQTTFDAERDELVSRSQNLAQTRASIESDIKSYNQLVKQYNAVNTESTDLNSSINSTITPSPSL